MGFATEGSLVLKHDNRKRISNKEFQVSSSVTSSCQSSLHKTFSEVSPRGKREPKEKTSRAQTTNTRQQQY